MVNIYQLKDPQTNEIRYVGKTVSSLTRRLDQHYCSQNLKHRSHNTNWINSLKNKGLKPIIELIERVDFNIWIEREVYWIAYYKKLGYNLTNQTIGGEVGFLGGKHTEEWKKRIAILNSRPKSKEWIDKVRIAMTKAVARPIIQFDLQGNFIKEWDSICFASNYLIDPTKSKNKNIHACCNGKRRSAYKFIWKYKEDVELKDKEPLS